jgi:hypothetical protein
MTSPALPSFASTSRNRYIRRQQRTKQQQTLRRKQRNADILLFLYSCGLIAFLVHLALS